MNEILAVTFPIYAIIGIGFFCTSIGVFAKTDLGVLSKFIQNVAMPAAMFFGVSQRPLGETLRYDYLAILAIAGLLTMSATYLWFTLFPQGPARRALAAMGSCCPNSIFVGYPVLLFAFPAFATQALTMNLLIENALLVPLSLAMLDMARPEQSSGFWRSFGTALWNTAKRPMIVALMLGFAVAIFGLQLPVALSRTTELLGSATASIALFFMGGSLAGIKLSGNLSMAIRVTIAKLFLHPGFAVLLITIAAAIGFDMPPDVMAALILSCSMPMFLIFAVFAQEYGHEGAASVALLVATGGAFITLNTLLIVLI